MRGDPKNGTSWFDELFEGGIILPRADAGENRALTILLTGPPGTGKSTLATELCFRSALSSEIKPDGLRSLYLTLEAHKPWLIENVNSFGWQGAASVFAAQAEEPPRVQIIPVKNESDLAQWASNDPAPPTNVISKTASLLGLKLPDVPTVGIGSVKVDAREILVVDSLNTIRGDRLDLFDCLMSLVSSGPKIIILILDSFPDRGPQVWDFSADIVIRLDRDYSSGYLIRTLEVEKARYQSHVWGKHQRKRPSNRRLAFPA
jgi:KaiC/GvpD/RAD55 family RecA-like ATPase